MSSSETRSVSDKEHNRRESRNIILGRQLLVTDAIGTNTQQTVFSDIIRSTKRLREVIDTGEDLRGETAVGLKQAERQIRVYMTDRTNYYNALQ